MSDENSSQNVRLQKNSSPPKRKFVNNSGKGSRVNVPAVVKNHFNWGAFLLSWIWGIGNKSYITLLYLLLCWIPLVNLGVLIWFGIKGNEWAWQNKYFEGVRQFHEYQKKWAIAGLILLIIGLIFSVFYFIAIFGLLMSGAGMPQGSMY